MCKSTLRSAHIGCRAAAGARFDVSMAHQAHDMVAELLVVGVGVGRAALGTRLQHHTQLRHISQVLQRNALCLALPAGKTCGSN